MTEHPPIQRWQKIFTRYPASEILPSENGEYVTYADHLAALRACERQMLDAAVQRVTELPDFIAAVQRVTELPDSTDAGFAYYMNLLNRAAVIDAIRGES